MIRSMTQGIMLKNVGSDPLPRTAAPPVIAPIDYDPIDREQTEVTNLRAENQEQLRLLELQFRTEIDDLRSTNIALANENQEQSRSLESQTREHQQFREEAESTISDLLQNQQINKRAVSFLYDQFKEIRVVAFSTGNCDIHGKKLPIPAGFEKQHCKFFTGGQGKHHGSGTGDVVPIFQTGDSMVLPYSGICDSSGGAYVVCAAKPVISEQELAAKKTEYRLAIS